jgi:hypothetical protein
MPDPHGDTRQQLSDAFSAFEATLREALLDEARQAVAEAVRRVSRDGVDFSVEALEFDLTIRHLRVSYGEQAGAPAATTRHGRPSGSVRTALLDAFANGEELTIDAIRSRLTGRGVATTDDNLHQHLRRLVKGGELLRAGRGLYTRQPA